MRACSILSVALISVAAYVGSATLAGCSSTPADNCTATPYISPVAVTLDHTITGAGNAQSFAAGYTHSGTTCVISNVLQSYHFAVSDPVDATTSSDDVVSCVNSSMAPITVRAQTISYDTTAKQTVYVDTSLPVATLTCK